MYQDMAPDAWYGTDNEGSALPDGQYYYTITADPVTDHESRNVRDTLTFLCTSILRLPSWIRAV